MGPQLRCQFTARVAYVFMAMPLVFNGCCAFENNKPDRCQDLIDDRLASAYLECIAGKRVDNEHVSNIMANSQTLRT